MRNVASTLLSFLCSTNFFHDIIFAHASLAKPREAAHAGSNPRCKAFSDMPSHALRKMVPPLSQEPPALRGKPTGYFLAKHQWGEYRKLGAF